MKLPITIHQARLGAVEFKVIRPAEPLVHAVRPTPFAKDAESHSRRESEFISTKPHITLCTEH